MIADETTTNFNLCMVANQNVKELNEQIKTKKTQYSEFLGVMKNVSKLIDYDDHRPEFSLIHEDLEEFEKLKTKFDETFKKANEEATEYKLHELIKTTELF